MGRPKQPHFTEWSVGFFAQHPIRIGALKAGKHSLTSLDHYVTIRKKLYKMFKDSSLLDTTYILKWDIYQYWRTPGWAIVQLRAYVPGNQENIYD